MLLNLDKPLKKATLLNEFCSFVPKPHGTKLKPIGRMGRDRGWFHVQAEPEAAAIARAELPGALVTRCPRCYSSRSGLFRVLVLQSTLESIPFQGVL